MFSDLQSYAEDVEFINRACRVVFNKIYLVQSEDDDSDSIFITFNVESNVNKDIFDKTILVHRKKLSNTLYTINALNQIIREANGGNLDFNYKINWPDYQNSLILTNEAGLRIIPTKIFKIINVSS